MKTTHYKNSYSLKTACGRSEKTRPLTTDRPNRVNCEQCQDVLARKFDADSDLGNYEIVDDMIGTARVRRNEAKEETTVKMKLSELRDTIKSVMKIAMKEASEKTWTAFVAWDGEVLEEIDVKAPNERLAMKLAQQELDANYQPGGKIVALEPARLMQVWRM